MTQCRASRNLFLIPNGFVRETNGKMKKISLILCFVLTSMASATTYYLDINASGNNDGSTWEHAWETLGDFDPETDLVGGDIVEVNDGDYGSWSFTRDADGDANYVVIQAASGKTPEVNGISMSYGYEGANEDAYVKFDGLNIINDDPNSGCVYLRGQSYVQFYNLTMSTVGTGTIGDTNKRLFSMKAANGSPNQRCTNIYLENCEINGQSDANYYTFGYGIYEASGDADNVSIVDCNIFQCYIGVYARGDNWLFDGTEIHNCTSDGILIDGGDGITIQDCNIFDCLTADEDGGQHVDLIQIQGNAGDVTKRFSEIPATTQATRDFFYSLPVIVRVL